MSAFPPPLPVESFYAVPAPLAARRLATPLRRAGAFLLDCLLLAFVAAVLGGVFFDTLASLGLWCRFIGLTVVTVYFGLMESSAFRGQSLGKVLVGLQVVNRQGGLLSVEDAALRTLLFWLPISLNMLPLALSRTPLAVVWLLGLIVFGLGGTTAYLQLFNRQTRQGVHDLGVGSYVVLADDSGALDLPPVWKGHRAVMAALIVCVGVGGVLAHRLSQVGSFPQAMKDLRLVEAMPGVVQGGVYFGVVKNFHQGDTTHYRNVTVRLRQMPRDPAALADTIALTILRNDPQAAHDDSLTIVLQRGYDVGFWSSWESERFVRSPAEWREHLNLEPLPDDPR